MNLNNESLIVINKILKILRDCEGVIFVIAGISDLTEITVENKINNIFIFAGELSNQEALRCSAAADMALIRRFKDTTGHFLLSLRLKGVHLLSLELSSPDRVLKELKKSSGKNLGKHNLSHAELDAAEFVHQINSLDFEFSLHKKHADSFTEVYAIKQFKSILSLRN